MVNLDSIRELASPGPIDFDIYVNAYNEIMQYLIHNGYTEEIDYTIYDYLDMFYNYYKLIINMEARPSSSITDMTYKKEMVTIYYQSMLEIYDKKTVTMTPYTELCNRLALLTVQELVDRIWFNDIWGICDKIAFQAAKFNAKIGMLEKMKRQKSIKDLDISYDVFIELLQIIQDYAFSPSSMTTDNIGDSAFCMIITKSLASIIYRDDSKGYLKDGIKYYLTDMKNYTKVL